MNDRESWLRDLGCPEEETRRVAVRNLGALGEASLVPVLAAALGDASWRVRKEAQEALLACDDPGVVEVVLEGLRDGANAGRRNAVVETVVRRGPAALPHVRPLLADPDPDLRKFGIDIMGGIGDRESLDDLLGALRDEDENVAAAAAEHLGTLGDARAVSALVALLGTPRPWLQYAAFRALGFLAGPAEERELLAFLDEPAMRAEAVGVLARIGGEASFTRLLGLLPGLAPRERVRVMEALAGILDRQATSDRERAAGLGAALAESAFAAEYENLLGRVMAEGAPEERRKMVRVAALTPSRNLLEKLVGLLEMVDEEEREGIIRALGGFPERLLPALYPFLQSESTIVRRKVARIFGATGFRDALPRLLPLARDEDGHVRSAVAQALGNIGDNSAVGSLATLLTDPYPDVREAAGRSLAQMAGADTASSVTITGILLSSLDSEREQVREAALLVLGNIGDPGHQAVFSRFLKDADTRVRRAAVRGLGHLDTAEARDVILSALADEAPEIRMEAIRRLSSGGNGRQRRAIMAMVDDADDVVAAEAIKSLGAMGGADVLEILGRAAREGTGLRQLAAIRALTVAGDAEARAVLESILPTTAAEGRKEIVSAMGRRRDPRDLPHILPLLEDADWGVRLAAVDALGRMGDRGALELVRERFLPAEGDPLVRRAMESLLAFGG